MAFRHQLMQDYPSNGNHRSDYLPPTGKEVIMQTWLITGVSSGFGREIAKQVLARGDRVAGTIRSVGAAKDLREQYGNRLWLAELDLVNGPAVTSTVNRAFAELERIDVIVNNAGYGLFGALEGLSDDQIVHQIAANLIGSIRVVRAAVPHLRNQGGGRILQLSTYGGQATHAGASLYHASKWGIEGFMDSIAQELAPFGIGVTIVEPGGARTNFRGAAGAALGAKLDAYDGTPAGMVHAILTDPTRMPNGDPVKMAAAMIASADHNPAPRRLVLGSDAFAIIRKALKDRLSDVEAQQEEAAKTDLDTL
ncbi:SDR family oxidoreductase [Methylobacterium variabile]|uniref:SDR family oxidoreductase n=1 Tax=Methylobacterium variabile TaxID=298794 RepID=UPI0031598CB3